MKDADTGLIQLRLRRLPTAALCFALGFVAGWATHWYAGVVAFRRLDAQLPSGPTPAELQRDLEDHTSFVDNAIEPEPLATEEAAYKTDHVELYGVSAGYRDDILDGRVAAVFGKLRNTGDRPVDSVSVVAYYLDKSGTRIYEQEFPAVLSGSPPYLSGEGPLKPGYVREFGFKAERCPTEWDEGKVEVEISRIKLGQKGPD